MPRHNYGKNISPHSGHGNPGKKAPGIYPQFEQIEVSTSSPNIQILLIIINYNVFVLLNNILLIFFLVLSINSIESFGFKVSIIL